MEGMEEATARQPEGLPPFERRYTVAQVAEMAMVSVEAVYADIKAGAREAEAKLKQALLGGSSDKIQAAMGAAIDCGSYKAVIARMDGLEAGELREAWDAIRDKANGGDVACFLALLAAATDGAVKAGFGAGDVIRKVAEHVGGRGGGRPNMAQAGGKDAAGIEAAVAAAREMLA